jgi:cystathionine beta-lyase/cystathionine gamma-synthase
MLRLVDVAACGEIAARHDCQLVVDNTFATPYLQNPLALGAHVSLHSTTKWIGGHSDVIGGAVIVDDEETHRELRFARNATGGVPGPWDAWLTLRGLKTLSIRMREHAANATRVAEFMNRRPEVARVYYPGLADHPGHALAKKQMRGFGSVVTVDLAGGEAAARGFCNATEIFSLAEGLGGVESMIGYPFLMSHGAFPAEEKRRKGISESTVRLSVGIENIEDLLDDLEQALARAASAA